VQGLRLNGHTEDGKPRVGSNYARQMGGAPRSGDHHANSTVRRFPGKISGRVRRAVRGEDVSLIRHPQFIKHFD